jgi:hypothetical protein
MPKAKKQFMFIHIPKTAGTTFVLTLARRFRWQKKLPLYFHVPFKEYPKYTAEYKNKFDLSYGHLPFDPTNKIERGIDYFTFFRDPRQRLLSGYKHLKGDGSHGIKKIINVDEYSLKDFLKEGVAKNFDNFMVRYMSGNIQKPYLHINEDDLKLAIHHLDTYFSIFGLTEYFDESLVLLSDHMKWSPLYYVRENKSSYKIDPKELDEETEQLISVCNKYDEILYQHASARFKKLMEEKKDIVEKGLKELREGSEKRKNTIALLNKASLLYTRIKRIFQ